MPVARSRPSFTLFEMVLVLALIVVLAALTYPPLNEMYASSRVDAAADQVRARLADARTQAVNEGRPYRFAVVRGRGNFRVAPDSPEFWANAGGESESANGALIIQEALPRGIRFSLGAAAADVQEVVTGETALPAGDVAPDMWASVVTFLPDGAAVALDDPDSHEIRIIFEARNARPVQLRLRTLTGTVTVRPLDEELRP
jgi:Tfp pilus assembly protein FimT